MGDRDIVDDTLGIISTLDWISPLLAIGGNLVHGGGYGINITWSACPVSGREIQKLLNRHGITNWAPQIVADTLMINVKKDDAARACSLLQAHGIPVENPVDTPQRKPRRPRKAQRRSGGVFSVFDVFDW